MKKMILMFAAAMTLAGCSTLTMLGPQGEVAYKEQCNPFTSVCTVSGAGGKATVKLGAEPKIADAFIPSMEAEARKVTGIENGRQAVIEVLSRDFEKCRGKLEADLLQTIEVLAEVEKNELTLAYPLISDEDYLEITPLMDYLATIVRDPEAQAAALKVAAEI